MAEGRKDMARYTFFTAERKMVFLEFYAEFGLRGRACEAANICFQTFKDHLKDDKEFAEAFEEAQQRFNDKVEEEIRRRSIEGVEEYYTTSKGLIYVESETEYETVLDGNGQEVRRKKLVPLKKRVYSDHLLLAYARRHMPEYRDKSSVDHNHQGGVLLLPGSQTVEEWKAANAPEGNGKPPIEHKP